MVNLISILFFSVVASAQLKVLMIDGGTPYIGSTKVVHVGKNVSIPRLMKKKHFHADAIFQFINRNDCVSYVVDWCNYLEAKVFDEEGYYHCLSMMNDYDVVNMSLAGEVQEAEEYSYMVKATHPIMVIAAGNRGADVLDYPSVYAEIMPNVLAISAIDLFGKRLPMSNKTEKSIDYVGIASYNTREGVVDSISGTSVATALYTSKLIKEMCPSQKKKGATFE